MELSSLTTNLVPMIGLLLVVATAIAGLLWRHNRRLARHVEALSARLDVFVETSINVARSVDRVALGRTKASNHSRPDGAVSTHQPTAPAAARRWLLQEAERRLEAQQSLTAVVADLGLVGDERRLLERARGRLAHASDHGSQAVAAGLGEMRQQV